jgi:hypothetical protein
VAGCGGGDDEAEPAEENRTPSTNAVEFAEVGESPTYGPVPVEGVKLRPPKPTVIASGQTSTGEPFEFVVYGVKMGPPLAGPDGSNGRVTCLMMIFPASEREGGGHCGEDLFQPLLRSEIMIQGVGGSGKGVQVTGIVSSAVDSVELSYEEEGESLTVDAVTEQISRKLLRQVGKSRDLGVFVGYLPRGAEVDLVTATAFDAQGDPVETTRWAPIGFG